MSSAKLGLPWWLSDEEFTCNAGDASLIPGLGRSPGEGTGNTLQYSWLEDVMDRGTWQAITHGVAKSCIQLSDWTWAAKFQQFCLLSFGSMNTFFKFNIVPQALIECWLKKWRLLRSFVKPQTKIFCSTAIRSRSFGGWIVLFSFQLYPWAAYLSVPLFSNLKSKDGCLSHSTIMTIKLLIHKKFRRMPGT